MNKTTVFKSIATFRNGLNFGKDSYGKGCKLLGVSDFHNGLTPKYDLLKEVNPLGITTSDDYLKKGDIVFVRSNGNKALVGRTVFINADSPLLFSGFCIRARIISDEYLPKFIAYFTKTPLFRKYISSADGTNINNLNQEVLGNVQLPNFPILYQKKVASFLSNIDKKIEINNRINLELETMAKTLYDYWFVQFDFPDESGRPYKSSGGEMVYSEVLKREIPIHWIVKSIADIVPIQTGKVDANFSTIGGFYRFFSCAEKISFCDTPAFEGRAILLAGNGNFSIKFFSGKFNAYQRTYVLIPHDQSHYSVVYQVVKDRVSALTKGSRGSIVKFITKGDIEDIHLALPVKSNLFKTLNSYTKKIELNIEENRKLEELRDWLLPMLMNGQVYVGGSED